MSEKPEKEECAVFLWAEYASRLSLFNFKRRKKKNCSFSFIGEREEETLLSYVICSKIKLSQMLFLTVVAKCERKDLRGERSE